jgi:hypothetical protein
MLLVALLLFLSLDECGRASSPELILILIVSLLNVILKFVVLELFLDPVGLLTLNLDSMLIQLQIQGLRLLIGL